MANFIAQMSTNEPRHSDFLFENFSLPTLTPSLEYHDSAEAFPGDSYQRKLLRRNIVYLESQRGKGAQPCYESNYRDQMTMTIRFETT